MPAYETHPPAFLVALEQRRLIFLDRSVLTMPFLDIHGNGSATSTRLIITD
jgi:hypothetical protein